MVDICFITIVCAISTSDLGDNMSSKVDTRLINIKISAIEVVADLSQDQDSRGPNPSSIDPKIITTTYVMFCNFWY